MRLRTILVLVLAALLVAGCAKRRTETSMSSWEMYKSSSIAPDSFDGASVAVLSAVMILYDPSQEIYREALSGLLYDALQRQKNGPRILPLNAVQSGINKAEIWDDYKTMITDYKETGVLRKDVLTKLGRALGVRYVLLPKLLRFQQVTFDRVVVLGISFLKTRESSVDVLAQLWDVQTGEVVWEGAGEGVLSTEVVQGKPVSFMVVAQHACDSLVSRMPWAQKLPPQTGRMK